MYKLYNTSQIGGLINLTSSSVDRKWFLKLLEEDEEFRLAVAAKIGLLEILNELRQHNRKFNEILEELREHRKKLIGHDKKFNTIQEEIKKIWEKLEEHDRKFNEILERLDRHEEEIKKIWIKLEEHDRKFNEILEELKTHRKKLEEHDRKFNAIQEEIKKIWIKLEEHDRKFNEILEEIKRIWEKLGEHGSKLTRIELEVGVLSESFYCKAVWDDLREEITARGEKIVYRKRNARIDNVDIDLLVETDKRIYLIEVKVRPKHKHIGDLLVKADIAKKKYPGKEVVLILAGAMIGREIEEYAKEKNILVYNY